jgi:hypothetical protein
LEDDEMRRIGLLRLACWLWVGASVGAVWAQNAAATASAPDATAKATTPAPATATLVLPKARSSSGPIRFSNEKAVLGLPLVGSKSRPHCAADGVTFFDLSPDAATPGSSPAPVLYSISLDGSVKQLLRKVPVGFSSVSVRDFYAGENGLATLLEADQRADGTDAAPPRETDYFLSLSDEVGDLSSLVQLQLRFKPLKVARFGSGDSLVLGWDEGNLLPVLALLKDDGTIHRFIDFEERRSDVHGDEVSRERVTLEALQGAVFVAYGSEVLLTYPGTTKAVRVLSAVAESRTIPIALPGGYVLRDVLVSSGSRGTLMLRVRPADDSDKSAKADSSQDAKVRMFEMDSTHGTRLREFVLTDKPTVAEVTCAANSSLTALFYDTIAGAANTGATDGQKQLVVATTRR